MNKLNPLQNYVIMMTPEGHSGHFQIQWLLPKLVLRLETMHKTPGQDNTEILSCVREELLSCVRENLKLCERKFKVVCEKKIKLCEKKFKL